MTNSDYHRWLDGLSQRDFEAHVAGLLDSPHGNPPRHGINPLAYALLGCLAFWALIAFVVVNL